MISYKNWLKIVGVLFVLPALLHLFVFKLYPLIEALKLSFFKYDLMSPPVYVGLLNYQNLWDNPLFHQSFFNSLIYMLGVSIPEWFLALALALLLNRPILGRPFIRLAYFIPIAMSQIVVAVIWKFMYHPEGLINTIIGFIGIDRINWLSSEQTALASLIMIGVWRGIPLFGIIYLAGLQSIPKDYHEAAMIDGANVLQRFFYITLPLLLPTILFVIVISLISSIKVFLNPLVITGGGPNGSTKVLPYFIYETGFTFFRMGEAAAASTIMFILIFFLTLFFLRVLKKGDI